MREVEKETKGGEGKGREGKREAEGDTEIDAVREEKRRECHLTQS